MMRLYIASFAILFTVFFASHALASACADRDQFAKVTNGGIALSEQAQGGGYFYQGLNDEPGAPSSYHYVLVRPTASLSGTLIVSNPQPTSDGKGFTLNLSRSGSVLGSLTFHTGNGIFEMASNASDLTVGDFKRAFGSNVNVTFQCVGGEE
jgi:hypothetical protein